MDDRINKDKKTNEKRRKKPSHTLRASFSSVCADADHTKKKKHKDGETIITSYLRKATKKNQPKEWKYKRSARRTDGLTYIQYNMLAVWQWRLKPSLCEYEFYEQHTLSHQRHKMNQRTNETQLYNTIMLRSCSYTVLFHCVHCLVVSVNLSLFFSEFLVFVFLFFFVFLSNIIVVVLLHKYTNIYRRTYKKVTMLTRHRIQENRPKTYGVDFNSLIFRYNLRPMVYAQTCNQTRAHDKVYQVGTSEIIQKLSINPLLQENKFF